MTLQKLISRMPVDLWQRLADQTREALELSDTKDYAYFKFVYQGTVVTPSAVFTEFHLGMDWEEQGQAVKQRLRSEIRDAPTSAPVNVAFAGRTLREDQSLSELGAVYGDKLYFNIGPPKGGTQMTPSTIVWSDYFRDVVSRLRQQPKLYEDVVDEVCKGTCSIESESNWSGDLWKLIVLMRNLPGIFAEMANGPTFLRTTQRLVEVLQLSLEDSRPALVYHLSNVLEWLAYLKPRMFEGYDLLEGDESRRRLADALLTAVDPSRGLPGRVRMEAAWALGWAGVASEDFGRLGFARLQQFAGIEKSLPLFLALQGAALRCQIHPTPYAVAALSQAAGWFQSDLHFQTEARRIAITKRQDELLARFRSMLTERLAKQSDLLMSA